MRVDVSSLDKPFSESYDYVIVGSGAAGATAARELADTGRSVCVLEEGPAVAPSEFNDRAFDSFKRLFRDMGGQVARGRAFIPVIQGRCLGGSTVINSAIVWRMPDDVWEPWRDEYGLGDALPIKELHRNWDKIEKELYVAETPPDAWGRFNELMHDGARQLGAAAAATRRNVKGCRGSCAATAAQRRRQSMLISYLPTPSGGAALVTGAKAEQVVCGATAPSRARPGLPVRARRRADSCFRHQTPGLLGRSGVDSVHLGERCQPSRLPSSASSTSVNMWTGATQGYDCDHHRKVGRFKIETIGLPPEIVFARMAGAGARWKQTMAEAPHAAIFAVQMRAHAHGTVKERFFGTDIQFDLNRRDMMQMRRGVRFAAELLFAAGAKTVLPGIFGLPERLTSPDQLPLIEAASDHPASYNWIVSHLFGTARMSRRACDGVIGTDFAVHGTKNLFVIDSSLFPTNIGVNPQHSIMGVAMLAAHRIASGAKP